MIKHIKKLFIEIFINTKIDEEKYYKKLFVENPIWNSKDPNEDELSRWTVIKEMVEDIGLVNEIIDVGCGRGWLANKLADYGSVTGIEPVASVVEYAKGLFPKIQFYPMKPNEYIEHFQKEYSLVVCSEVLEHVHDKAEFIRCLNELTKENGHLIITTPRGELKKLWEDKYGKPAQPIEEWIATNDLQSLLISNGFEIVSSKNAFAEDIYQIYLCRKKL